MLKHLNALVGIINHHDPSQRLWWWFNVALTTVCDFGIIYCLLIALEKQRAGESFASEGVLYAVSLILWYLSARRMWARTGQGLATGMQALTDRLIARIRRMPLDQFERLGRGDLMTRLTGDTQRVVNAGPAVIGCPKALLRLSLGALFALTVNPGVAGVAAAAMVILGVAIAAQMHIMKQGFARMAGDEMRLYDLLQGHVAGIIPLKLNRRRAEAVSHEFNQISNGLRNRRRDVFILFFQRQHLANAILYGVLGVNVFLVPLFFSTNSEAIREINVILVWVVFSVLGIVFTLPQLTQAGDALERLRALDNHLSDDLLEPEIDAESVTRGRFAHFRQLDVCQACFHYPSTSARPGFGVGPIDQSFKRGEIVFITGFNGSGKSTFLKMLTGLYPLESGDLQLDGQRITRGDLADYRALFSTVFTDYHLFARAFGVSPEAEALAHGLLEEMEIAHKTSISDGWISNRDLSAGQRKRLAMVLARLQQRPILIFDEWAADQDPEYREIYYKRILPALRDAGKLIIAVTHDDQYFYCADRMIQFKEGELQVGSSALGLPT